MKGYLTFILAGASAFVLPYLLLRRSQSTGENKKTLALFDQSRIQTRFFTAALLLVPATAIAWIMIVVVLALDSNVQETLGLALAFLVYCGLQLALLFGYALRKGDSLWTRTYQSKP